MTDTDSNMKAVFMQSKSCSGSGGSCGGLVVVTMARAAGDAAGLQLPGSTILMSKVSIPWICFDDLVRAAKCAEVILLGFSRVYRKKGT